VVINVTDELLPLEHHPPVFGLHARERIALRGLFQFDTLVAAGAGLQALPHGLIRRSSTTK
jgi:hypothetical protein